ncbi:uncharacterized protein [Primulina eburnea]|uniref:uncharacterized protein n=1 Tax=Primulina eburnea TaxID=1245227 RepID=UPI003C6BE2B0
MNWLSSNGAVIDIRQRSLFVPPPRGKPFISEEARHQQIPHIISRICARKLMRRGYQEVLDSIVTASEPLVRGKRRSKWTGEFWLDRAEFLGHTVTRDLVEVNPSKVEVVRDCPVPKSVTEIRSFLGLAGHYRKFIQGFSSIVVPMNSLTKKNAKFIWGLACQESFDRLKKALTLAPVLAMPSVQGEFVLYTDALKLDLGTALMQHDRAEILRFELEFYARGDAPSLSTVTMRSTLRDRVQEGQTSGKQLQNWRQRDESKGRRLYPVEDDTVRYRDRSWIPSSDSLIADILSEAHSTPYSIHPESTKIHKDLQSLYWWPGMK